MGIVAKNVDKLIGDPGTQVLTDISLEIQEGEFVALTGKSGSGKSTLLYLLSSLDFATRGQIEAEGRDLQKMSPAELGEFRNSQIGFVFQFHYLIAELTALENILLPAKKLKQEEAKADRAQELLRQFGLEEKGHRLPRQLSGGEQQRVAIARSLVMNPRYVFADEPTGSLDTSNGERVMEILQDSNQKLGTTLILVTHDPGFAKRAHRQIHLIDGKIIR